MAAHLILSKEIAYRKLQRMAYEIAEQNMNEPKIILAGIKENGTIIAKILNSYLTNIFKGDIDIIEIAIDKKNGHIYITTYNYERKTGNKIRRLVIK